MPTRTTEHYITGFGPKEWTGKPLKDSGSLFFGSGFLTFLLCLLLMIFIPPLRDIGVIIFICTLMAIVAMCSTIASNVKRDKVCLQRMTEQVNAFILETTGDPKGQINLGRMQAMVENKRYGVQLSINGVPGIEIKAVAKPEQVTHVSALLTSPEFGLESFDLLLGAESRKP